MDDDQARAFLKAIGSPGIGVRLAGDGRTHHLARCPLAPWRHEKAKDNHPSFSVAIGKNREAIASCFSCGFRGSLYALVMEMETHQSVFPAKAWSYAAARQIAVNEDEAPPVVLDLDDALQAPPAAPAYPEAMREAMDPAWHEDNVHPYLSQRGVSAVTARLWDLRWDAQRLRIVMPIRDFGGVLRGLHGRAVLPDVQPRWYAYQHPETNAANRHVLLGEHRMEPYQPVLVVESVFDLLRCFPVWPNIISPLAASFPITLLDRLDGVSQVFTLFDADKAGDQARKTFTKHCPCLCTHLKLPDGYKDPGETPEEILRDILAKSLGLPASPYGFTEHALY